MCFFTSAARFCLLVALLFIFFSATPHLGVFLFIMAIFLQLYKMLLVNEKREVCETTRGVIGIIKSSK